MIRSRTRARGRCAWISAISPTRRSSSSSATRTSSSAARSRSTEQSVSVLSGPRPNGLLLNDKHDNLLIATRPARPIGRRPTTARRVATQAAPARLQSRRPAACRSRRRPLRQPAAAARPPALRCAPAVPPARAAPCCWPCAAWPDAGRHGGSRRHAGRRRTGHMTLEGMGHRRRALAEPILVAAHVFGDAAVALEGHGARDDVIQESAIVADHQQRAGPIHELRFQQLERLEVQIVGGLVQHQNVGGPGQQPCQQQPVALAAGQRLHRRSRAFGWKQEVLQVAVHVARAPATVT